MDGEKNNIMHKSVKRIKLRLLILPTHSTMNGNYSQAYLGYKFFFFYALMMLNEHELSLNAARGNQ